MPYRDFPFVHPPLEYLLHAAIIRVFGLVYYPHIVCAALESGLATVLTWRILLHLLQRLGNCAWLIATLLAAPLIVVGIYAIYPHPIYDSDCILAVLLALMLLQCAGENDTRNFVAGAACVLPLFVKQNIGLPFLAVTLLAVALVAALRHRGGLPIHPQLWISTGAVITLGAALLAIHITAGLHNYLYWTIHFAAQRRLPGLNLLLETYRQTSLLWTIPAALAAIALLRIPVLLPGRLARFTALVLLAAPFLWTIAALALTSDADDRADQFLALWPHLLLLSAILAIWNLRRLRANRTLNTLLPIILLATIEGAFLSQQLWGSTYALWPLLLLLIASMLLQVPTIARRLAAIVGATLLLCGGLYAVSHERLSYAHLDGPAAHATLPGLRGLTSPGPWIPDFEELVRFANADVPSNDSILLLPGDVPFYFATGRAPQFPVLLFDPATNPYTPQQVLDQARAHNIRWLIVTRNLQITIIAEPDLPEVLRTLQQDFVPYRSLTNYDIYRRK
jgi:hypothetical protein